MIMKLSTKLWLFVGWTTTAAGIASPAHDARALSGTKNIPTAAEFDTYDQYYEHHDPTTADDSEDNKAEFARNNPAPTRGKYGFYSRKGR